MAATCPTGFDIPRLRAEVRETDERVARDPEGELRSGDFDDLPVADGSVDVVISNGVVNLSPDEYRVFDEIYRVLMPGPARSD